MDNYLVLIRLIYNFIRHFIKVNNFINFTF